MKQNPEFIITEVAGDAILVPVGKASVNFNSIISLNEMGKNIWNMLGEETSAEELVKKILAEYDVSEEQARADLERFLGTLRENGAIEEVL